MQFAVQYEHRASTELKRMDVINAFVEHVPKVRHSWTRRKISHKCKYGSDRASVRGSSMQHIGDGVRMH
jgi:hypothetical protein